MLPKDAAEMAINVYNSKGTEVAVKPQHKQTKKHTDLRNLDKPFQEK